MTLAQINDLRQQMQGAMRQLDRMEAALTASRAGMPADSYNISDQPDMRFGSVGEAIEEVSVMEPVRVEGWTRTRDIWVVKIAIGNADGDVEGDEIMEFASRAELDAYVASMTADAA